MADNEVQLGERTPALLSGDPTHSQRRPTDKVAAVQNEPSGVPEPSPGVSHNSQEEQQDQSLTRLDHQKEADAILLEKNKTEVLAAQTNIQEGGPLTPAANNNKVQQD